MKMKIHNEIAATKISVGEPCSEYTVSSNSILTRNYAREPAYTRCAVEMAPWLAGRLDIGRPA
jgi:hypothetical protein